MNEKFLIQTDDLLLAGIFWDSSDTRIFPASVSYTHLDVYKRQELGSVFFRTLATMFFVMVITGCIVACVMTVYIVGFLDDESDLDLNSLEMNYTSILYVQDKSTGEYVELNRLHGEENRIWVDYENIPDHLINAAIAGEDRRFKEHQGVDWKRCV